MCFLLTLGEMLTTHSARRSFVTNEHLNGMPSITIK